MAEFTELPSYLIDPPEVADKEKCEQCGEELYEGDTVFYYQSSYADSEVTFCGYDCAVGYFNKHDLEEGKV